MHKLLKSIVAAAVMLTSSNAWALGTCISGQTVLSINTYFYQGAVNNGDSANRYSVKLSNGKYYDAADGCNSDNACGQANLSLLLSAFSAGYLVTLYGSADNCTTFYGVAISH